jgi:CubicO group peptidase (beta-lactamase class C family)
VINSNSRKYTIHSSIPGILAALLLLGWQPAAATEVTLPEELGISAERLKRVEQVTDSYVTKGRVTGIVTMITRHGRLVHASAKGQMGLDNEAPMALDTLFSIYSMTKAVTAVAALILYEEGHFHLDDPVSKFLPAFSDMQVEENGELRPVRSPMTMHHLFTHMSGLGYVYGNGVNMFEMPDTDTFVETLAARPLKFEPGEGWGYSYATDVLGIVVEKISGQPLGEFMKARLFEPLGMQDTFFEVPADQLHRLASSHNWNKEGGTIELLAGQPFKAGYRVMPIDSGGLGLFSTVGDYLRFLEMLRQGGKVGAGWILSPKTIKYMSQDHLPKSITDANIGPDHDRTLGLGGGHGLGIGVYIDPVRRGVLSSKGELDWGGATGTVQPWRLRDDLSVAIYQSLTTSLE